MKKVVLIPNSFKGTLDSIQICSILENLESFINGTPINIIN